MKKQLYIITFFIAYLVFGQEYNIKLLRTTHHAENGELTLTGTLKDAYESNDISGGKVVNQYFTYYMNPLGNYAYKYTFPIPFVVPSGDTSGDKHYYQIRTTNITNIEEADIHTDFSQTYSDNLFNFTGFTSSLDFNILCEPQISSYLQVCYSAEDQGGEATTPLDQCFVYGDNSQPTFIQQGYSIKNTYYQGFLHEIQIEPILIKLKEPTINEYLIGYTDNVTLSAESTFTSDNVYNWQYQIVDNETEILDSNWANLGLSGREITFKASDYFPTSTIGKKIIFRTVTCGGLTSENVIVYELRNSSPKITTHTTIRPSCYGSSDGSIQLTFDKALQSGELMSITVEDRNNPIGTEPITGIPLYETIQNYNNLTSSDFDANNSIVLNNLPSVDGGNYIIHILNGIQGGEMNYSSGTGHTLEFTLPQYAPVTFTSTATNIFCKGGKDGTITLTASGGIPSKDTTAYYEYLLNKVYTGNEKVAQKTEITSNSWIRFSSKTTHTITGLGAGTYQLQVRDSNDCIAKDNGGLGNIITETIVLTEPAEAINLAETYRKDPTGNGLTNGQLTFLVTGGTRFTNNTYQFELRKDSPTGSVINTVTSSFDSTTEEYYIQYTDLGAGIYYLTVKDAHWASASDKVDPDNDGIGSCGYVNFELVVNEPEPITGTITEIQPISCNDDNAYNNGIDTNGNGVIDQFEDGILQAAITGGVPFTSGNNNLPYKYQWEYQAPNSTTYQAVIQEGSTYLTQQIEALAYGNYRLQVEDANGNQLANYLYFELQEPEILNVTLTTEAVLCSGGNDGKVFSEVTGGTMPYTYQWNNGATSANLENLAIGIYSVQITDVRGCVTQAEIEVSEPNPLLIEVLTERDPTCFEGRDGEITIAVTGGIMPYTYEWSNGETLQNIDNLTKGMYTVTVTDANLCSTTQTVTLTDPPQIPLELGDDYVLCFNESIDFDITISDAGAQYLWTQDGVFFADTPTVTIDRKGIYEATITSSLGCVNQDTIEISRLDPTLEVDVFEVTMSTHHVSCYGGTDGEATIQVTGGAKPYTYQWNNGATTETISNLTAGTYFVFITDANGCRVNGSVTIVEPQELTINTLTKTAPTCYGGNDGVLQVQITGGTAPYSYEWNTGEKILERTALTEGTYTITVTDGLGCTTQKTYTLADPDPIQLALGDDITLCTGQELDFNVTIDDPLAIYSWTKDGFDFANTAQVTINEAGTYTAKVYSSLGCEGEDTIVINTLNQKLEPEYLVSSEAFVGENIILVNVSDPQPQAVEWIIPNGVTVVNEEIGYLEVIFPEEGSYEITLRGTQEACAREYTKSVVVHKQENLPDIGDAEAPFIEEFVVAPNPNDGNFNAYIKLQEESPIVLNVFNMLGNKVVDTVKAQNEKEYTIPYQILGSGVYIIVLETPKGREIRKIVVL